MKASNKIVESVVSEVAGQDVIPLVKALKNRKNISEFKLAEDIKKEINATRNMLYRLYDANLVSFIRKKDKKKGWYIYYWTFNAKRIKELTKNLKNQRLEKLKDRLAREKSSHFFACKNKCIRLDFDQSTDFEYKCPECGNLLLEADNAQMVERIEKEIKEIEKALKTSAIQAEKSIEEESQVEAVKQTKPVKVKKLAKKKKIKPKKVSKPSKKKSVKKPPKKKSKVKSKKVKKSKRRK